MCESLLKMYEGDALYMEERGRADDMAMNIKSKHMP